MTWLEIPASMFQSTSSFKANHNWLHWQTLTGYTLWSLTAESWHKHTLYNVQGLCNYRFPQVTSGNVQLRSHLHLSQMISLQACEHLFISSNTHSIKSHAYYVLSPLYLKIIRMKFSYHLSTYHLSNTFDRYFKMSIHTFPWIFGISHFLIYVSHLSATWHPIIILIHVFLIANDFEYHFICLSTFWSIHSWIICLHALLAYFSVESNLPYFWYIPS